MNTKTQFYYEHLIRKMGYEGAKKFLQRKERIKAWIPFVIGYLVNLGILIYLLFRVFGQ